MITYEEIYRRMKEKYAELSGAVPDDVSDIALRLRVLGGEIYSSLVNAEWIKRQMFADTAEGEYLDRHAESRGLLRRGAGFTSGEVTFSLSQPAVADVEVPKGTIVATSGEAPLRFETLFAVVIGQGETEATAFVRALEGGRAYNVKAGEIRIMVTSPAGVDSVSNRKSFSGGTDTESDEALRQRIIDSFKLVSNGTNCAYYKNSALSVEGVSGAGVVPRARGAGTVDVYISADGTAVSDETLQNTQNTLSKLREVNVDVLVKKAEAAYTSLYIRLDVKDGFEFSVVKDRCIAEINDYVASRGVAGSVILTEAGERIFHIEGVKEYCFVPSINADLRCGENQYPVLKTLVITEGVVA
ncbi:MAG: baseplate J/gp47 family protein [Ruminococcus sp.]